MAFSTSLRAGMESEAPFTWMAMALAVAGARIGNVVIDEPTVVAKTYPGFFTDFLSLLDGRLA